MSDSSLHDAGGSQRSPTVKDWPQRWTADVWAGESPPEEVPAAPMVTPSPELAAFWDLIDEAYGEPEPTGGRLSVGPVPDGVAGDFALVEQVAFLEQVSSWARAQQLATIEVLAHRPSMNPSWPIRVSDPNITAEEIAARLGTSRAAGRELVETARLFAGQLAPTAEALDSGDIDWVKARIVVAALRCAAGQVAYEVQARVLPRAGRRTPAQLRADLQRALIDVDPADAEQRAVRAIDERRVCRPRVLPDGMAGIWAVVPAAAAAAIDAALNRRSHLSKGLGDPRTVDQLRADAFSTSLIADHEPCHHGQSSPAGSTSSALAPSGGSASASGSACNPVPPPSVGHALITVTVAMTTLLGLDEKSAELAGYGPITAQTARRLAADGTWRRLVADPTTGAVLDVGRRRYRPPEDLAEIIRARDQFCLAVICNASARDCDLDHREPFREDGSGGATSEANLGPLCRRDHLIKTHGQWHMTKDVGTNITTWTTPTGHIYTYAPPHPLGPATDEPLEPGLEPALEPPIDPHESPPPF